MFLIFLTICVGIVQKCKVMVGGLVSPLRLHPLGILVVIGCICACVLKVTKGS